MAGPDASSDARRQRLRRLGVVAGVALVVVGLAAAGYGYFLWRTMDARIDRETLGSIEDRGTEAERARAEPLNVLVVGSDSREGLTASERRDLHVGDFEGNRPDTLLLVQTHPDGEATTVVFLPRDLRVEIPGHGQDKVNAARELGGPDLLVDTVEEFSGVEIDHYVEVAIPAFLAIVDAIGPVEVCLDEPLVDPKSGADFAAGCHDMDAEDALAFVRSRRGDRGDFRRIERQQTFIRAVIDEMTSATSLLDPVGLLRMVERVGDSLTTDDALGFSQMRQLAGDARDLIEGRVVTATVPGYTRTEDGVSYVEPYPPGVRDLFAALRSGSKPGPTGDDDDRADTEVAIWTGGHQGHAAQVESVLYYLGFVPDVAGPGPDLGTQTVVYRVPGDTERADRVGAGLGAPVQPLPPGVAAPQDADVVVAVGARG